MRKKVFGCCKEKQKENISGNCILDVYKDLKSSDMLLNTQFVKISSAGTQQLIYLQNLTVASTIHDYQQILTNILPFTLSASSSIIELQEMRNQLFDSSLSLKYLKQLLLLLNNPCVKDIIFILDSLIEDVAKMEAFFIQINNDIIDTQKNLVSLNQAALDENDIIIDESIAHINKDADDFFGIVTQFQILLNSYNDNIEIMFEKIINCGIINCFYVKLKCN